jgi:hypothetical protein
VWTLIPNSSLAFPLKEKLQERKRKIRTSPNAGWFSVCSLTGNIVKYTFKKMIPYFLCGDKKSYDKIKTCELGYIAYLAPYIILYSCSGSRHKNFIYKFKVKYEI